jgi:hypothetical protein
MLLVRGSVWGVFWRRAFKQPKLKTSSRGSSSQTIEHYCPSLAYEVSWRARTGSVRRVRLCAQRLAPRFVPNETLVPPCCKSNFGRHLIFNDCDLRHDYTIKQEENLSAASSAHACMRLSQRLPTNMHYWSLIRILFRLTKNFVRDRSRIALAKRNVFQKV